MGTWDIIFSADPRDRLVAAERDLNGAWFLISNAIMAPYEYDACRFSDKSSTAGSCDAD